MPAHLPTTPCACQRDPVRRDPTVYDRQARILKALANPARLRMVDHLASGECSVSGLTALVGLDQSTVSKHLAVLRSHGIVADRREGNVVFYRLLTPCVLEFFACADRVLGREP
jgi:DNA-binding transcriptional ArsR family regulator